MAGNILVMIAYKEKLNYGLGVRKFYQVGVLLNILEGLPDAFSVFVFPVLASSNLEEQ